MSKNKRKQQSEASAKSRREEGYAAPSKRFTARRRRRRGNNILLYLLILVFMVATTVWATTAVFFKIKSIHVTGNSRYDTNQLILTSGILLEENMFRLNDEEIEKELVAQYSYIADVNLRRRLPDTVILEVTEAVPYGAIDAGAGYTLISKEGRVLECNIPLLPEELPVVMGFGQQTPEEGTYLQESDSENVTRMNLVMDAAEETGFVYFDIIDLSDPYDIKLYYEDKFEIVLGTESDLSYKLELVDKVIETEDLPNTFVGTIDASYDGEVWTRPSGSRVMPEVEESRIEEPSLPEEESSADGEEDLSQSSGEATSS